MQYTLHPDLLFLQVFATPAEPTKPGKSSGKQSKHQGVSCEEEKTHKFSLTKRMLGLDPSSHQKLCQGRRVGKFRLNPGSGEPRRAVSKRVVLADVPPERKPERGYVRQNHPFGNRPFISQWPFWVLTKGWFPKGWFRRMFPRNENRNEGTFAKTTLLRNRPFISQWLVPEQSSQTCPILQCDGWSTPENGSFSWFRPY